MPAFSDSSLTKLKTCHEDIQKVAITVIKYIDFTIIHGHRDNVQQNMAYNNGHSTKKWPDSKHNKKPSTAIDIAPYPIDWHNKKRFYLLAGYFLGVARMMNINLRWGGDWDGDHDLDDQKLYDLGHFERGE